MALLEGSMFENSTIVVFLSIHTCNASSQIFYYFKRAFPFFLFRFHMHIFLRVYHNFLTTSLSWYYFFKYLPPKQFYITKIILLLSSIPSINHLVIPKILLEGLVIIHGITRLLMLGIEDNESIIFCYSRLLRRYVFEKIIP